MHVSTGHSRDVARRRIALAAALMAAMSGVVHAQETASPAQMLAPVNVTVTGSRIRGTDVETAQPVFTMDRQAIRATGLTNLGDIVARMPSAGTAEITPQDTLSSGTDAGGRYANLRQLGAVRTLVLVNGRRWTTSLGGLTDLSTIPVAIVERIEVLKDGASSIYGSDAIGGVINILTTDRFEGASADVLYGVNGHGDGTQKNGSFTWGKSTERASLILGATYEDADTLRDDKRALTRSPYGPRHPDAGFGMGPYGGVVDPRPSGTPGAGSYAPGGTWDANRYVVNHPGGMVGDTADLANYHPYDVNDNADKYATTQDMTFRSGSKLRNLFGTGRYNLTDDVTLRGMASYGVRDTRSQSAGYPLQSSSGRSDGLSIDPDNAYNPFPGYATSFFRRTTELPRVSWAKSKTFHADGGAEGSFQWLDHAWNWDVTYAYSETRASRVTSGNIDLVNARKALGPTTVIDGRVACADAADRAAGCVPWNILAGPGGTPDAVWNYVASTSTARQTTRTNDVVANLTGGLLDLPAGTLRVAGGIEHRGEHGRYEPDTADSAGLTTQLASDPTDGGYIANEAYLEFDVPLLADLPLARELAVNASTRYSHYSAFGGRTNNKYSLRWKPFDDLLLRATYAEGFRAPTVADLYAGSSETFESFVDPCDSAYGAAATDAAVRARCATSGVPANYRQVDQSGAQIASATGGQNPVAFRTGANPQLKPETSITRTAGLVYSPSYVEGLDVTLDYYKVDIRDVITPIVAGDILNFCYVRNDPTWCGRFTRAASGEIVQLDESLANLGSLRTEGYDLGVHYRFPETRFGEFTLLSDSTYLSDYTQVSSPGAAPRHLAGYMNGVQGLYRVRSNLSLDWSWRRFGATWTTRYFSGLKDACWSADVECNRPTEINALTGATGVSRKGGVAFHDLQLRWQAPWNGNFRVGVNNVFGRRGPLYYNVSSAGGGSPPYDPAFDVDRYYYVGYQQRF
ncbi:TonB-dependent receptor plug domain-containing protein [Luteibacter sp. UNCMF366Tsu5.1]|uniref:TonB-dependent receptor plug domain-containing protein n=1 Tax=Luteibacter sp. UNCMF366Tsu5.1 TaxID=1502758 RepID=UPI000908E62F|nr:TonB-dependent receptor [Luteibacter sp. UNCMF366Tsu5.1]SFW35914.1 iron complex outermembrane recepter protein [Luteibacter sp. UNCMF366Tsu5.1]